MMKNRKGGMEKTGGMKMGWCIYFKIACDGRESKTHCWAHGGNNERKNTCGSWRRKIKED